MLMANRKKVEMWYEPCDKAHGIPKFECEMSRDDHGYLCGLLKEKRPRTIMEIGVAEGGTTLVIDIAMNMLGVDAVLYSIDISPMLYYDKRKKTGWIYSDSKERRLNQTFMLGHTVGGYIWNIKEDIDFVLIDTTHIMPGELLDFLAVLPYLHTGTIVVLHDVNLNIARGLSKNPNLVISAPWSVATKILYASVTANKYAAFYEEQNFNIAAFEVNEHTRINVYDVFWSLTNTWKYVPDEWQVEEYRKIYEQEYDAECNDLFEYALRKNREIKQNERHFKDSGFHIPFDIIPYGSNIILYGAGVVGQLLFSEIKQSGYCTIVKWVDRDYDKIGNPVKNPREISIKDAGKVVVAVEGNAIYEEIKGELIKTGWKENQIIGPIKICV